MGSSVNVGWREPQLGGAAETSKGRMERMSDVVVYMVGVGWYVCGGKACRWSVMIAESTWDRLVFILHTTQLANFGK
jgi:hypothetical protein